ncbi:MAG: serine hydrolase [Candidatus Marinimicrobia bacterium]|nr:serine hydrolase [Candidatus Neomarinimicrobiota bacterium]
MAILPGDVVVGIAYEDLLTGNRVLINDQVQMHAASTMKVPVMMEVFNQTAQGRFALTDSILVTNKFHSIVDGSDYWMDIDEDSDSATYQLVGRRAAIYDLTYAMITVSSNLATNNLMALVGAGNVMATLKSIGVRQMQVLRGVEDLLAYRQGLSNTTNARDMMVVMSAITRGHVVSPQACAQMRTILLAQQFNDKIPRLLPPDVKVAHKTGNITAIDHDAAIVYLPDGRSYSLTILTSGIEDHHEAQALVAELSQIVYRHYQDD